MRGSGVMKIPFMGKSKGDNNDTELSTTMLDEKFQFDVTELLDSRILSNEIVDRVNQKLVEKGLETIDVQTEGHVFVSIWAVELIMQEILALNRTRQVSGLTFVEYDFPDIDQTKKSKSAPTKEIIESYELDMDMDDYIHIPKAIADYFMNLKSDDVGYEGRQMYIEEILDFYDRTYSTFFTKFFGLMPSEAITIPSEQGWMSSYSKGTHISVSGGMMRSELPAEESKITSISEDTPVEEPVHEAPQVLEQTSINEQPNMNMYSDTFSETYPATPALQVPFTLSDAFSQLEEYRDAANIEPELYAIGQAINDTRNEYGTYSVDHQVAVHKQVLNDERLSIFKTLNASAEQKMGSKIDAFKHQLEQFDKTFEFENDPVKQAHAIVDPIILKEKNDEKQHRLNIINQEEQSSINEENTRHETEVKKIHTYAALRKDDLTVELDEEFSAKEALKYEMVLDETKQGLVAKKDNSLATMLSTYTSELATIKAELQTASNSYISDVMGDQQDELARFVRIAEDKYSQAQLREAKLENVEAKETRITQLRAQLADQEQMHQTSLSENETLKKQIADLASEIRVLREHTLDPQELAAEAAEKTKLIQENESLLREKLVQDNSHKINRKVTKIGVASAAIVMILVGGICYTAFDYNQKMQASNASLVAKNKEQEQQIKDAVAQAKQASETQAKQESEKKEQAQVASKKASYQLLDDALTYDDLSVYRNQFSDNKLGDNEYRIYRVGQLLAQQGDRQAAEKVAKANPEYSEKLRAYLGM